MIKSSKIKLFTNYDSFISNSALFYYVILILEFIPIALSILESTSFSQVDLQSYLEYVYYLNYANPLYYVKTLVTCEDVEGKRICYGDIISYLAATCLPYLLAILLVLTLPTFNYKKNKNTNSKPYIGLLIIFVNVWEITMTVLTIPIIFLMVNYLLITINDPSLSSSDLALKAVIYFLNLILFLILKNLHMKFNNFLLSFDLKKFSYKDTMFTPRYNYFILFLQILTAFKDNFGYLNQLIYMYSVSAIILFTVIFFTLTLALNFTSKKVLFLTSKRINMLRLALVIFIFFEGCYKFVFGKSMNLNYVTIPNFVFCLILSKICTDKSYTKAIESSDLVKQLALILIALQENKNHNETLSLIRKCEWNNSFNKPSKRRFKLFPDFEALDYCYYLIKHIEKEMIDDIEHILFDSECRKLIKLCKLILYRQDPSKKNKFIFAIKKEMMKTYPYFDDYEFNCLSLFSNTNLGEEFFKISKINKIIEMYSKSNNYIDTIIKDFESILENSSITFNESFYRNVANLASNKANLKKSILYIFNKRSLYINNFNFFTVNYSFEYLFKEKINEIDMVYADEEIRETLKFHYKIDNILCLSFSIKTGDIKIMNYSRDFSHRIGENFETLFPDKLRDHLKTKFTDLLELEFKNTFSFFYFNPKTHTTRKCDYTFVTYQNLKSDVIYILGNYTWTDDNLLFTNSIGKVENVENTSLKWVGLLGLDPSIAEYLIRKKANYSMLDMFTSRKCNVSSQDGNQNEEKTFYQINQDFISGKFSKYVTNEDLPEIYLNEMLKFSEEDITYKVYTVHSSKKFLNRKTNDENDSVNGSFNVGNEIPLVEERTSDSQGSSSGHFNEPKGAREIKKIENKVINRLALSTLFYNFLLIIYCIGFLVIGYTNTSQLKAFYTFRSSFNNLKYFWFHSYLSLYQNILLYVEGTTDNSAYSLPENNYFGQFLTDSKIKIDVASYCINELGLKLDMLKTKIGGFQADISTFSSGNSYKLDEYFSNKINLYAIRNENSKFFLEKVNISFFDSLSILLNKAYTSFDPGTSFTTVWLISFFDGEYELDNIVTPTLATSQYSVFEIAINYLTIQRFINNATEKIDNLYADKINSVSNINAIMSIILVVLHVFYITLCSYILNTFDYFIQKYNLIITIFNNDENIQQINKKLYLIRCLNQLYTKNPSKYIGDIEKLNKNENDKILVLKKKFSQDNEKFISDLDNMKKSDDNVDSMDDFRYIKTLNVKSTVNLVLPFVRILVVIFIIYAVFFGITYYFFVYIYNLFIDVNSYSTDFMNIQNTNLNNALITQTIFNINVTDTQLNKFMTGDATKGYLRTGFSNSFETLKKIRSQEDHPILSSILLESEQISQCKNIYSLSDVIYKNFDQITMDSLIETCSVYKFTNHGTLYTFNYELLYLQQSLLNAYEQTGQDYTKMKTVWDSFPFFDQLVINNLIMRPITDYFYNTLIYDVIISCIDNFVLYSLFYLICNMLADILILYLINRLIINKIRKQDREIKEFIMWT